MADRLSRHPKGAKENDYIHHLVANALKDPGDDLIKEGKR